MMNWRHLRHYDMLYTCALSLAFSKLEVDCSLQLTAHGNVAGGELRHRLGSLAALAYIIVVIQ